MSLNTRNVDKIKSLEELHVSKLYRRLDVRYCLFRMNLADISHPILAPTSTRSWGKSIWLKVDDKPMNNAYSRRPGFQYKLASQNKATVKCLIAFFHS
jgi:hypothetical protein